MTELLPGVETPSDAELISRVRGGDVAAYGELFARHVEAARRLARQLMRGPDVDDLVSDAFAKTLGVIQGGGGPDVAFRAYLLTSVRRLHVDRIRAAKKVQPSEDMTLYDDGLPFTDTAVATFENGAAARAFSSLPERWQLVLWHLEVEGQKPAEIAPLLGMTPNSVSALAYRAREGLRQAFLTMHLADCETEQCRWVNQHLGAYVRKGLSRRDSAKVQQHLDECRPCTAMYLELTEVNSDLAAVIGPLVLGVAAAGYLSSAGGGALTGVSALVGRIRDAVGAHGSGAGGAGGTGATGGTAAGGAAAGSAAVGGAATTGGAIAAGGVIAAGVAAVTTAAVLFGGSGPAPVTEAQRPTPVVQSPAAGVQEAQARDARSERQTRSPGDEPDAEEGPGSRSASEVVVLADRPKQGSKARGRSQGRAEAARPANPGAGRPPAPARPTLDLPGPLPGVPVPPVSAPKPPVTAPKPPAEDPAPPPAGTGDPAPKPEPAPEPPQEEDKSDDNGSKRDDHAGGDEQHGKDGKNGKPGSSSVTVDNVVADGIPDGTTEAQPPAGQPVAEPADPEGEPTVSSPAPADDASQVPASAEEPSATTRLTIKGARMTRTALEFELTGSGDLPHDVTVALAEDTSGVAFVPEEEPRRHLWEEGGTLRVTIPVVVSGPISDARLLFTVDAGEGFEFVGPSGERLTAPLEPTYDFEGSPARIEVADAGAVMVDRDGSGEVLVSVEGVDEEVLLMNARGLELVLAGAPSETSPSVQVTGVVPGEEPGTFLVSFRIPPGHLDHDEWWMLRIGVHGPTTDPFLVVRGHRASSTAAGHGADDALATETLPTVLVEAAFGEGL